MASQGFIKSEALTAKVRQMATEGKDDPSPDGKKFVAQHIWTQMKAPHTIALALALAWSLTLTPTRSSDRIKSTPTSRSP